MIGPQFFVALNWVVLAQNERFATVTERFQSGGNEVSWSWIVGLVVALVVAAVVLWRVARVAADRDGRSFFSARRLFKDLCRLHELDWPSRRILRQLARSRKLEHPAQLFLEPACFDAAHGDESRHPLPDQLAALREKLFATESEAGVPPSGR